MRAGWFVVRKKKKKETDYRAIILSEKKFEHFPRVKGPRKTGCIQVHMGTCPKLLHGWQSPRLTSIKYPDILLRGLGEKKKYV